MNDVGKPETATQDRVMALFSDEHEYRFIGDWTDRVGNSHVELSLSNCVFGNGERC